MTIDELRTRLANARAEIIAAMDVEGEKAGADTAALVEQRIVSKGQKSDGGQLSPYSTKPVPAFLYFGKSRNQAGERAVRAAAKKKQGVSYRDFRGFNGLNVTPKNLQFTGRMWQGFGIVAVRKIADGVVEVEIGGKTPYSRLLLDAHSKREQTEITAPSKAEIQLVTNGIEQRLRGIIQRNLS